MPDAGRPLRLPLAASIEATPLQILETPDLAPLFPAGTRVYLPALDSVPVAATVEAARRLSRAGFIPVPHLAARRIEGPRDLASRLVRLVEDGGVTEALVVAGGLERPVGAFASSMDLLATGLLEAHGIRRIGVAGHPEGSPDISEIEIDRALAWKNDYAARTGSELRVVTQFCFDAAAVARWADRLAASGNRLPLHVGVAGPAKITTLLRYAAICGVGASLAFMKKKASALSILATSYSPEALVAPIEAHAAAWPETGIAQIHVFPFGGLGKSGAWLRERGSWPPAPVEAEASETDLSTVTQLRIAEVS